jgi:hypothetical protein
MLRLLLSLAVIGLVIVTMWRMLGSQLGGVARITGADLGASAPNAPAPVTPRAAVDQTGQAVHRALQQGAEGRASEAGN